ncbi:hypothetical protein [Paenibacillus sp. FSL L8-0708]|uniref:hypothetical protein n=1 Tax=Paenibacillus sp. FSL L8-0708 TaxID=2975311 RepID=UPI0030F9D2AE
MMKLFHPVSQGVMLQPVPAKNPRKQADNETTRLRSMTEAAAEWEQYIHMNNDQRRLHCLSIIQERRWLMRRDPGNEWGVYALCKAVYELAELDRVDFNRAEFPKLFEFIRALVPQADNPTVLAGVLEYYESRKRWPMAYLQEPAHEQADRL